MVRKCFGRGSKNSNYLAHDSRVHNASKSLALFFMNSMFVGVAAHFSTKRRRCHPGMNVDQEIELNVAVREYLSYAEYQTSLEAFDAEIGEKGRRKAPADGGDDDAIITAVIQKEATFLDAFHKGERSPFFKLWDDCFPSSWRLSDPVYGKLEFLVNIYFAVWPLFQTEGDAQTRLQGLSQTMEPFKKFLETRGSELSKTPQFLSYYALPYIPDPREHPSFKELFEKDWAADLERRLRSFLRNSLKAVVKPRLLTLLNAERDAKELEDLKKKFSDLESQDTERAGKHRDLQSDYHNLITIASELVQTLTACIHGQKITPAYLAGVCQRLATFKQSNQRKGGSVDQRSSSVQNNHAARAADHMHSKLGGAASSPSLLPAQSNGPVASLERYLNYEAITTDLQKNPDVATDVLKALTMLAAQPPTLAERRKVFDTYLGSDVLGIRAGKPLLDNLLERSPSSTLLQTVILINRLTTASSGREYLLHSRTLIPTLLRTLKSEPATSHLFQQTLQSLQKLSLRRGAQSQMNDSKTVSYLIELLDADDLEALGEPTVEYAAALMMNLCLRKKGKGECCMGREERVLKVLTAVMEVESLQVKTYVNGTLYSLFTEPTLRDAARAMGMEDMLRYMRESEDDQLVGQIDFVLGQLAIEDQTDSANQSADSDAISEDGQEEDEDEEEEEEENEGVEVDFLPSPLHSTDDAPVNPALVLQKYTLQKPTRPPSPSSSRHPPMPPRRRDFSLQSNASNAASTIASLTRPATPQFQRHSSTGGANIGQQHLQGLKGKRAGGPALPPVPGGGKGGKGGVREKDKDRGPISAEEEQEIEQAFSTRPRIARTPLPSESEGRRHIDGLSNDGPRVHGRGRDI
ncbi:uncharacterized protein EV422DRAFT_544511, partial [Fimicolochytrium jonesii]|uniref:uncharacterized protein n=1 Tax=Fimicolochytrium jonesii TaxID=1396493 RepID=UPI0022FE53C5